MSSSESRIDARATDVAFEQDRLRVDLADGRRIEVPLAWFPRLRDAGGQREAWELLGDGQGIRWPGIDEDLSVAGLLEGSRAPG